MVRTHVTRVPCREHHVFDAEGWTFIISTHVVETHGIGRYLAALEAVNNAKPGSLEQLPHSLLTDSTIILDPMGAAVKRRTGTGSERTTEVPPPVGTGLSTHHYLYSGGGWVFAVPVNAGFNEITMSVAVHALLDMVEPVTYEALPLPLCTHAVLAIDPDGHAVRRPDGAKVHAISRPYVPTAEARAPERHDSLVRQRIVAGAIAGTIMRGIPVKPEAIDFHGDGNHLTFDVAGVAVSVTIGEGPWSD